MALRARTGLVLIFLAWLAAAPAKAVVLGTSSSLGAYTVRLSGNGYCTGVAIARRAVVTAAHCARGMRVSAYGHSIRVAGIARSATLDDGRHVSVTGDAAILRLAEPLPSGIGAAPVGPGDGDSFTIAGYGTTNERAGGAFGSLHEASLVAAGAHALVDPNRAGSIGASACFGDSGGPVMRGGMLVGIITRAAHPSPRIACGHLTRWAPITVSGEAATVASVAADDAEPAPPQRKHKRAARRLAHSEPTSFNLFASWFTEKAETRRTMRRTVRRKQARQ